MSTETKRDYGTLPDLTPEEVDALVRGYSDEKLADLAASASEYPGTEWDRLLSAEMRRRGLTRSHLWSCGCLINDAGAHRVGCPDHPEGVRG